MAKFRMASCAVKTFKPLLRPGYVLHLTPSESNESIAMGLVTSFLSEASYLLRIRRFPHIVQCYGVMLQPEPAIVMELVYGGSLLKFLHNTRPVPAHTMIWFAQQIASGMAWLHDSHDPPIIHR